jgi:DNA-binding MarR family transcriptional regulator
MPDALSSAEFTAYAAFVASSTLLERAIERNLQEQAKITQVQFEILMQLSEATDGRRMADLAERLIVSRSGLTYQVSQLEKDGLITRERHGGDERGIVARITPAGEKLRKKVLPGHLAIVRQAFFDQLDAAELEIITNVMSRVASHLR